MPVPVVAVLSENAVETDGTGTRPLRSRRGAGRDVTGLPALDDASSYDGGGSGPCDSSPRSSGCVGRGVVGAIDGCAGVGAPSMYGSTPAPPCVTGLSASSISNGPRRRSARRRRYQNAPSPAIMTNATPPTVPPTIAPTLVLLLEGKARGEKPSVGGPSRGMLKILAIYCQV